MKLKKLIFLFFFISFFLSCNKEKETTLPLHNKRVLILGNSITQNGSYVTFLEYFLRKNHPKEKLDIISVGLSSETVSGDSEKNHPFKRPCILSRLNRALELTKPDVVISCYGMNDGLFSQKDSIRFSNYKKGMYILKETVENTGARLILLTPTPFDKDAAKNRVSKEGENQSYKNPVFNYNSVLQDYGKWLFTIDSLKVINLHEHLSKELVDIKSTKLDSTFIPDAVHPNLYGHFYMAEKIINELYPHIKIDDAILEINRITKDTLYRVIKKRREIRSKGWLNYIGYTRNKTVKSDTIQQTITKVNELSSKIQQILNTKN